MVYYTSILKSTDSTGLKWGNDIGDNEMLDFSEVDKHGFNDTFHSYYNNEEADDLFIGLNILHKGKSSFEYTHNDEKYQSVTIDYIIQKN